jgi:hypothetical protein
MLSFLHARRGCKRSGRQYARARLSQARATMPEVSHADVQPPAMVRIRSRFELKHLANVHKDRSVACCSDVCHHSQVVVGCLRACCSCTI